MSGKYIILFAAATLVSTSCSLLKSKIPVSRFTTIGAVSGKPVPDTRTPAPAPAPNGGQLPDIGTLCGGKWIISAVDANAIDAEDDAPYLYFENGTGRFYGSDGCNIINGSYVIRTDGSMMFSHLASTMRYCPDNEYAALIGSHISEGRALFVDTRRIGQDTYIYLSGENRKPVLTLRRHNMEFLNGNWQVTSIDGRAIDDEECNVFFDIAELKIHGNTGCNFFNGDLYIDPSKSNALDINNIGETRMACNKGDQELRMIVALESTASAIAGDADNTVLLLDADGKELMTLRRIPLSQENAGD